MDITFTGKQVDIGESLRSHVLTTLEEQVSKYFTENEASGHVVLSQQRGFFQVHIQIHIDRGFVVSGKGEHGDAYGAYTEALEHVAKRLRRHKRRITNLQRSGGKEKHSIFPEDTGHHYVVDVESIAEEENDESATSNPLVIAEHHNETRTMSVREAVAELDMHSLPFLLFYESKSKKINLVYQRQDGHIGWIDP